MGGVEGKWKGTLCEVNTRDVSREQNELIGDFKMAAGVVVIMGIGYEVQVHSNGN